MIAWILDGIVDLILAPQAQDPTPAERRAYLDPDASPLNVNAQEIEIRSASTRPVSYEIGQGLEVAHELVIGLVVEHGDRDQARARRDGIVLDLILRLLDVEGDLRDLTGPGPQSLTRLSWEVDYSSPVADSSAEWAAIRLVAEAQLDR